MRQIMLALSLVLAQPAAQAESPMLDLVALSPTRVDIGGTVAFELRFSQIQDDWHFSNGDGEPTADVGFQMWRAYFYELRQDTLTDLDLGIGAPGGPAARHSSRPGAGPGTDYSVVWQVSLQFDQAGTYLIAADAESWQDRVRRSGATVGTRECVGFDNSVQCTAWSFHDEVWEDTAWTESSRAGSRAIQVQVVPEPSAAAMWFLGLAGLGWVQHRRRAAR